VANHVYKRLKHSQRGNAIFYLLAFGVAWFAFFGIWNWIKSTKDARFNKASQQEQYYDDPYLNSAAHSDE
jgi:hypothetical protein